MNVSLLSNNNWSGKNDLLRLTVFCSLSILIHAILISTIKIPTKDSVINTFKSIPIIINKPKTLPIPEKVTPKIPAQDIKPTPIFSPPKKTILNAQQKPPKHPLKQVKKIITKTLPKAQKEINKIEKSPQIFNSIQLRNESLNFVSEMILEQEITDKDSYVFDPALQQKINQARHDKELQQELHPDELELSVDDKNTEYDGYRETICWLIPTDDSFDPLDARIVMLNPNCDKPKDILFDLIKSLTPPW